MAEQESNVYTEIETGTAEDQVWVGLTDFEKLPERSLWLHGVNKTMALGEVSTAYFKNPITDGMIEFTHEVIVYEVGCAFGWSGDAMLGRQDRRIFKQKSCPMGARCSNKKTG
ncbi:MAG: hypothetical protein ACO3RM_05430 [Paracoccaceae bacterium]